MQRAILKSKEERRLLRGHLWAYRNEFQRLPELADGDLIDVAAANGRFVGRGFYQAAGGIAVRLLSRHERPMDEDFWRDRVSVARAFRESLYPGATTYRWLHGESDGLPGLVADRYGAVVSVQTSCAFHHRHAAQIAGALLAAPAVSGVLFRFNETSQSFGDAPDDVECVLDDLRVRAPVGGGQKTGLFLDQRENMLAMRRFAKGARVLDGHCYAGLWSCHAARAGAVETLGVDTSEAAIARAEEHAALNEVADRCRFQHGAVEDALASGERYGLIVLDPPALAKSRAQTKKALARYQTLNRDAITALEPGGVLVTSSCSHFVDAPAFLEMLKRAVASARRQAWTLETRGASPDHPVLMAMPETAYLKCVMLRVE